MYHKSQIESSKTFRLGHYFRQTVQPLAARDWAGSLYWCELFLFFDYLHQIGHPDRPSIFNYSEFAAAESSVASTFEMSNIGGDESSPQHMVINPQPKVHLLST